MEHVMVYLTAPDAQEARAICRALLEARLIACANILPEMRALYRWEGEVQEGPEVAAILKTRAEHLPALIEKAKSLHPYECPCIVALPIAGGYAPFLQWIAGETMPPPA